MKVIPPDYNIRNGKKYYIWWDAWNYRYQIKDRDTNLAVAEDPFFAVLEVVYIENCLGLIAA